MIETARLCVSELVTNAVIHSGTSLSVTVRLDDECVLIRAGSRRHGAARRAAAPDQLDISGKGLTLVDAMAHVWGAEHNADGRPSGSS